MNQVRYIPIESIITTNEYLRLDTQIDKLKKSIEAIGLIHPLIVNKENQLLAGGRRYSALKELGHQEIPVVIVENNELEQELISIDENLMRLPLKGVLLEKALNRGRDIYEQLHPEAKKVSIDIDELNKNLGRPAQKTSAEVLTPEDEARIIEQMNKPQKESFVEATAQKTGLSEGVIRSAIIRDQRSSDKVKEAREQGVLNASQTNEIVRLAQEEQDLLLPHIESMSTKSIRKWVKDIQDIGLDETIEKIEQEVPLSKEYDSFLKIGSKFNRLCAKILAEELSSRAQEKQKIVALAYQAISMLEDIVQLNTEKAELGGQEQSEKEVAPAPTIEEEKKQAEIFYLNNN